MLPLFFGLRGKPIVGLNYNEEHQQQNRLGEAVSNAYTYPLDSDIACEMEDGGG